MKLYLIGLPGSGKSFLAKKLAEEVKIQFIDLDKVIEQEAGDSVNKIFSEKGEEYFRTLEAFALRQQSKTSDFIMACGGGTPCFHDNMKFITETGKSIFLNIPITEIVKRLTSAEKQNRPLLAGENSLKDTLKILLEKRVSVYNQATLTLTDDISAAEILQLIKR